MLGLALTPLRGYTRVYPMDISPSDPWDQSVGPSVGFLFSEDLTYPYVRLTSLIPSMATSAATSEARIWFTTAEARGRSRGVKGGPRHQVNIGRVWAQEEGSWCSVAITRAR
jgi:hypothetical protein